MFLFLIVLILIIVHFYVLYFFLFSFGIVKYKIILFFIAFFLSLTFILASILTHFFYNNFVRLFYFVSSFWLGLLSNLFFSFLIVFIFYIILKFFNINLNTKIFTSLAIIFSIFISFYGIYNANNPIINNINIKIKNLPESWKNKKIVQISDLHIGAIIGEKYLNKIIKKINFLNPDIIFITGDLFDGTDGDLDNIHNYLNLLKAKDGIYFVNGNHEIYLGDDVSKNILSKTNIKILDNKLIIIDGVQIIGLNYLDEFTGKKDITENLNKIKLNKNLPSILLYHAPVFTEQFAKFGINLQLSGHTHKGQIWPFGIITNNIYNGKDYGLFTTGNYNIYTTNGVGTWGPPMRIGNKSEIVILNLK